MKILKYGNTTLLNTSKVGNTISGGVSAITNTLKGINFNFGKKVVSAASLGYTPAQWAMITSQLDGSTGGAYGKLWTVNFCIDLIAKSAAGLPLDFINSSSGEVAETKVSKLLNRPNSVDTFQRMIYMQASYYWIDGNTYLYNKDGSITSPNALYTLRSQDIEPIADCQGFTKEYRNEKSGTTYGLDEVIRLMNFNPSNPYNKGISKLKALLRQTQFSDLVNTYKTSVYKNQARPSGALTTENPVTNEQFIQLKERINALHTGADNAGKVLFLDNGLTWQKMGLDPNEVSLIQSENMTDANIATGLGVPPQLVSNLSSSSTYNNVHELMRFFYLSTPIPFAEEFASALSNYFYPNGDYKWVVNRNKIPILKMTTEELKGSWWLTPNQRLTEQNKTPSLNPNMDKNWIPSTLVDIDEAGIDVDGDNL